MRCRSGSFPAKLQDGYLSEAKEEGKQYRLGLIIGDNIDKKSRSRSS